MEQLRALRAAYEQTFAEYQEANEAMLRLAEADSSADEFHLASVRVTEIVEKLRTQRAALARCIQEREGGVRELAVLKRWNRA